MTRKRSRAKSEQKAAEEWKGPKRHEVVGLALFTLAFFTFFSLLDLARGDFLLWWRRILRTFFGWGSYGIALMLFLAGVYLVLRDHLPAWKVPLEWIVALEVIFLVLLAFTHLVGGGADPLAWAYAGGGGGLFGWAISELLRGVVGPFVAGVILILTALMALVVALGWDWEDMQVIWGRARHWLALRGGRAVDTMPVGSLPRSAGVEQTPADVSQMLEHRGEVTRSAGEAREKPKRRKVAGGRKKARKPAGEVASREAALRRRVFPLPPLDLLDPVEEGEADRQDDRQRAEIIERTLANFGVPVRVISIHRGPTVTQFGVEPGYIVQKRPDGTERRRKVRVSRIAALANDLALALAVSPVRIQAPIPGQSLVGIEVPNTQTRRVSLRGVMQSPVFQKEKSNLKFALGQGVSGEPIVADLAAMPHLLIAGATGSGKSVCVRCMVLSFLYHNGPDTLRLVMIDPKRVELAHFNGLPHLYGPVEFEVERVIYVLRWMVQEMERRYRIFSEAGARNLEDYNRRWPRRSSQRLPNVVLIIDELADLMLAAPDEVERHLCRLAQMARATGIHLVVATQRPSVDVVTGLIKANFPARISFNVSSQVDSRVILDVPGAERLIGAGDMLFLSPDGRLIRAQGCYASEAEIARTVSYWKEQAPDWIEEIPPWEELIQAAESGEDELLQRAIELVRREGRASASMLQRRLRIGYPRAARLIDKLEEMGIIGPPQAGGRDRQVLG